MRAEDGQRGRLSERVEGFGVRRQEGSRSTRKRNHKRQRGAQGGVGLWCVLSCWAVACLVWSEHTVCGFVLFEAESESVSVSEAEAEELRQAYGLE